MKPIAVTVTARSPANTTKPQRVVFLSHIVAIIPCAEEEGSLLLLSNGDHLYIAENFDEIVQILRGETNCEYSR